MRLFRWKEVLRIFGSAHAVQVRAGRIVRAYVFFLASQDLPLVAVRTFQQGQLDSRIALL
jgi:hypothetical protein